MRGVFIAKASPQQNGYSERFNSTMEVEVFGHELYHSVLEVQVVVDEWLEKYNPPAAPLVGWKDPGRLRQDAQGSDSVHPDRPRWW